jgi:8-oxo-dGTP diphosphatase
MTEPVVALAVVTSPLGVLLIQRRDRTPPWSFPGGTIEPGETAEQAAERETLEETGLRVRALRILGRRSHPITGRELVYVAANPVGGTDARATEPAVTTVRWASRAEVHELLPELYGPVADHLTG